MNRKKFHCGSQPSRRKEPERKLECDERRHDCDDHGDDRKPSLPVKECEHALIALARRVVLDRSVQDYLSRSGKPGNSDNTLPFLTVRLKRMVLERIPNCALGDFRRFFGNHTAISPVQGQKPKNPQYTRDGKQQQVWHQATHGQQFTPRYVAAKKMQSVATTGNHFPML